MTKSALLSILLLGFTSTVALAQTTHATKSPAATGAQSAAAKPAGTTAGAKPTDAEVRRMFVAMGMKEQIDNSMKALFTRALDQQTKQAANSMPSMDESDRSFFMQVQQQELTKATDPAFLDSILAGSVTAYKTHLSAEDVRQLTVFYESPAGKHYQAALPEISKEEGTGVRTLVQERGKQIMQDQQARLQSYIAKKQSAPATPPASAPSAPTPGASAAPAGGATAPAGVPGTTGAAGAETSPTSGIANTPGTTEPATPAAAPVPPKR